jgi:hypothetical protein
VALIKAPITQSDAQALWKILDGIKAFLAEVDEALAPPKPRLTAVKGKARRPSEPRGKLTPVRGDRDA